MSLHYVSAEKLQTSSIPQLETRCDGGTLHVRHSAENHWDIHRARGQYHSHNSSSYSELTKDSFKLL